MNRNVMRVVCVVIAGFATGCGGSAPPPTAPAIPPLPPAPPKLSLGTIDVRPFSPTAAFAKRRRDQPNNIDIMVYERPITFEESCRLGAEEGMVDTERYILIQMPWPAREGSMWHSGHLGDAASYAGLSFSVRRGLGGSGQTASGIVRVERASPTEGVLYIDGATANTADGVHGAVRGSIAFKLCR